VEITLAIGIVAFAFVALFGLLPVGMNVFRESIDRTNEMWIMQNLNSMIQVTEWREVEKLSYETSGEIYYYDEEGRLTDSEKNRVEERAADRLYAVKLIVDKMNRPAAGAADWIDDTNALRIVAVLAPVNSPSSMAEFHRINKPAELEDLAPGKGIRSRAFLVARMDSKRSTQ
jgi:uncharacterized protein (TIGR02598 family)